MRIKILVTIKFYIFRVDTLRSNILNIDVGNIYLFFLIHFAMITNLIIYYNFWCCPFFNVNNKFRLNIPNNLHTSFI